MAFKAFSATATANGSSFVDLNGNLITFTQSSAAPGFSNVSTEDAIKDAQQNAGIFLNQAIQEYKELLITSNAREVNWVNYNYEPFVTSDGATLYFYYQPAKNEKKGNMLFIPGWSQSPDSFSPMITTNTNFTDNYDIYILAMRGYNLQEQNVGNCMARYAADVKEFIESKKITDVIPVTHSMGCSVIWYFIGLYGEDYFKAYIFIDQCPILYKNPRNTDEQNLEYGSIFDSAQLFGITNTLIFGSKQEGDDLKVGFVSGMFTPEFKTTKPNVMTDVYAGTINYYNIASGQILFNHICINQIDDVLRAIIKKPSLLIGGVVSIIPFQSIIYEKQFFQTSEVKIFTREQGGSHFMFVENPELTNQYANEFLEKWAPI